MLSRRWDRIIENPAFGIYEFPLFTEEYCQMLTEEVNEWGNWKGLYHPDKPEGDKHYATTDVYIGELQYNQTDLFREHVDKIHRFVSPIIRNLWDWTPGWFHPSFVARYEYGTQQTALEAHSDASIVTVSVQLDDGYTGGGTFFVDQEYVTQKRVGWCQIHPGRLTHRHGAMPITSGKRHLLVTWLTDNEQQ
jgi:hypothetical protein